MFQSRSFGEFWFEKTQEKINNWKFSHFRLIKYAIWGKKEFAQENFLKNCSTVISELDGTIQNCRSLFFRWMSWTIEVSLWWQLFLSNQLINFLLPLQHLRFMIYRNQKSASREKLSVDLFMKNDATRAEKSSLINEAYANWPDFVDFTVNQDFIALNWINNFNANKPAK